ncbi:hypothetical protein [Terrabacter sp. BE26]|uniref:hypothetical protein n=1 Tax=Terrabacter sp. BE26 TaxID=2898152 RepID=UPI0035BEA488
MATDADPTAENGPAGSWVLEQRGSFVLGRCEACGFTTSARRARFSVETDMLAHTPVCVGAASAPRPQGAPGVHVGASGRERLSAQGRS